MKNSSLKVLAVACVLSAAGNSVANEKSPTEASKKPEESSSAASRPSESMSLMKGWAVNFLQPSLRFYFDYGSDDPGEIDLYNDGSLVPSINLIELYRPYVAKNFFLGNKDLLLGPAFGFGLTAPAKDGQGEGAEKTGDSPVLLLTGGAIVGVPFGSDEAFVGIEAGYAWGMSFDEGFADGDDLAIYVGLSYKFRF
jgi:hypothetical protein